MTAGKHGRPEKPTPASDPWFGFLVSDPDSGTDESKDSASEEDGE